MLEGVRAAEVRKNGSDASAAMKPATATPKVMRERRMDVSGPEDAPSTARKMNDVAARTMTGARERIVAI
jgi:hypothetical protein